MHQNLDVVLGKRGFVTFNVGPDMSAHDYLSHRRIVLSYFGSHNEGSFGPRCKACIKVTSLLAPSNPKELERALIMISDQAVLSLSLQYLQTNRLSCIDFRELIRKIDATTNKSGLVPIA